MNGTHYDVTGRIWVADDDAKRRVIAGLDAAGLFGIEAVESRHVIEVTTGGWAIQHPLECRPDMLTCPVHVRASLFLAEDLVDTKLGRYVVKLVDEPAIPGLSFERLEAE